MASRKRRRPQHVPADDSGWIASTDARVAHARSAEDLAAERVQRFDQRAFLAAFGTPNPADAAIEWTVTDEFTRRFDKLRGRSRRAFAAALEQLVADLLASPAGEPRFHESLHVRPLRVAAPLEAVRVLSWSAEGRATFVLDGRRVTWLAIGPHGSPNRKGARNR
ncbi:MAG: hypothetical protein JWM98_2008 [Thermoleophilia bacterium]|nr:hypothetical protein [Thermoleophilia bacterium]